MPVGNFGMSEEFHEMVGADLGHPGTWTPSLTAP